MISAIIVALNEEKFLDKIIYSLQNQNGELPYEIILADGGSQDNSLDIARNAGVKVVQSSGGKAFQINEGAKIAKGDVLFFVHADFTLHENTFLSIQSTIDSGIDGGGFRNVFDRYNEKIKRLGHLFNLRIFDQREQSDKGIFYGDNGIYVKKSVFQQLGGFKEIPIMEDYEFSNRLRKHFKVKKINEPPIIVSSRRHIKEGFVKTRLQWVLIKRLYLLGVSPHTLAKWYKHVT